MTEERPTEDTLRFMRCPTCNGMPAYAAKWARGNWAPGKFCSCPFEDE